MDDRYSEIHVDWLEKLWVGFRSGFHRPLCLPEYSKSLKSVHSAEDGIATSLRNAIVCSRSASSSGLEMIFSNMGAKVGSL